MAESWSARPSGAPFHWSTPWTPAPLPAGFFRRALAALIDWAIVFSLCAAFVALGVTGASLGARASGATYLSSDLGRTLIGLLLFVFPGVSWLYITLFTYNGGQTPGKMLMGIRVVRVDGSDISFAQALLRPLGYLVSSVALGLGFVLAAVPPAKRALHDHLTGTRVIRSRRDPFRPAVRPHLAYAWLMFALLAGSVPASAAVVERIVAVVNKRVITQSDVVAYRSLGQEVGLAEAVHALVDRRLLLEEADRFAIPSPDASAIDARIDALSSRVDSLQEILDRLGWDHTDLRAWIADTIRVDEFLRERIYFFVLVSPQDVDTYYDTHQEAFHAIPLEEARDEIRRRLTTERGDDKRDQFLAKLRERATIRINLVDSNREDP